MTNDINDFTHLHLHSIYSICDGENVISNAINRVKELGMKQVALTDHGTMMGALNFYKTCKTAGIKSLIGQESYCTQDPDDIPKEERTRDNHHLVMIAQNNVGYQNLMDLSSRAYLNNFYFKPRISKHNLTPTNTEGIIACTACLGSPLSKLGTWNDETNCYTNIDIMYETADWYSKQFPGRYYLEIQDNDDQAGKQKAYNQILIKIGKELNLPMVITADAHYTTVENSELHSILMAMQLKKTLEEYKAAGEMKYGPWFYIRSSQEMLDAARKYNCEEAFWNACKIGNSCQVDIELGKYKMPSFDFSQEPDYEEFMRTRHDEEK